MHKSPLVQIKVLDPRLNDDVDGLPAYHTPGAAAVDLRAMIDAESVVIPPNGTFMVSTGLSVYVGDPDYAAIALPRSGLGSKKGLVLGNLVGLIDSDYQGPLMLCLWNRSQESYRVSCYERVAQLMFLPVARPTFKVVSEFDTTTQRGAGGFGSTGTDAAPTMTKAPAEIESHFISDVGVNDGPSPFAVSVGPRSFSFSSVPDFNGL